MPKGYKVRKEFNVFYCETCAGEYPEYSHSEILEHLASVHGIAEGTSATRSMICHMDGSDFYSYKYGWDFGTVKLTHEIQKKREHPWY